MKKLVDILEEFGLNSVPTSRGSGTERGTDKGCYLSYIDNFYETEFDRYRRGNYKVKVLELGIRSGASLKLWKEYFPNSEIIAGIDNKKWKLLKKWANIKGVSYFWGNLYTSDMSKKAKKEAGLYDIIIDDADHRPKHMTKAMDLYLPLLKEGGVYIIEDINEQKYPNILTRLVDALPERYKNSYQLLDYRESKNKLQADMLMVIRG